jgi:hypothetical protein
MGGIVYTRPPDPDSHWQMLLGMQYTGSPGVNRDRRPHELLGPLGADDASAARSIGGKRL